MVRSGDDTRQSGLHRAVKVGILNEIASAFSKPRNDEILEFPR